MTSLEKIVSLSKRRGFIYPGSEIYGGLANTYDYGPLGVELKNNIKKLWWEYFIYKREDMIGLDGGILLNPKVWEASGHLENFKDSLVECLSCHKRFRPDKLKDSTKCPECGGKFTEPKMFLGMFKTIVGPIENEGIVAYFRPETAQAIFINFKNILDSTHRKIPFGVGQIGKAFRNEITTGNFIFRTYEFEQMEIEYFINPNTNWQQIFEDWLNYILNFAELIGLDQKKIYNHEIPKEERTFYSQRTIDIEYQFPFGQDELWAIAYRTDYDLKEHQKFSGEKIEYFNNQTNEKYIPHVIEPTFGVDRTLLALLCDAYTEEKDRIVLKLKPQLAPIKVAVFPLLANKPELVKKAQSIYEALKEANIFPIYWDDRGNIGKRYYSQDEIGTPYCVTIDFKSLEDNMVTIRDRDTMAQERIKIKDLVKILKEKLED